MDFNELLSVRVGTGSVLMKYRYYPVAGRLEGPSCGLIMPGMRGWLVGAGHPDPSLTRFSDVKTFNRLFLYKAGT